MRHTRMASVSAAAIVVALGSSGCSNHVEPSSIPGFVTPTPTVATTSPGHGPLPTPEALTDVLYRLADVAVPGADKLPLVQNASPSEAGTLDSFAAALRDGGFTPVTFTASEIRWSDAEAGNALATVKVTTTNPGNPGEFTFPMDFRPGAGGWQLSRDTADMLLAVGDARGGAASGTPVPTSAPR